MLKFLRKYNKWILVVAASFLMVAFLAPQAIQQWGRNVNARVVARIGEDRVRLSDLADAGVESRLAQLALPPGMLEPGEEILHWLLLRTEAERAGFMGGLGDGQALMEEVAAQIGYEIGIQNFLAEQFSGFPPQFLPQLRPQVEPQWQSQWASDPALQAALTAQGRNYIIQNAGSQMMETDLYQAMANVRGVRRMFQQWMLAGALSERRALAQISDLGRQAWANALVLPASDLAAAVPEPSEEELQAHFQRFNSVSSADGQYGFGYILPPRIKLETLVIDRAAIREAITPDAIELRKLHASQKQPAGPYPEDFTEAREQVENALRSEIAEQVIEVVRQAVGAALLGEIRDLDTDAGYRVVTDDYLADRTPFSEVAEAIRRQVAAAHFPRAAGGKVEIPLPVVTVHDRWLTPEDVAQLPTVAESGLQYAGGRVPLSQALFQVREIAGDNNLALQTGLPAVQTPATTPGRGLVYFTILDTRPQSPPDSLDDIREQVIEDYRNLTAYESLRAELDAYRQLAITDGLEAAAARFAEARADAAPADVPAPEVSGEIRFTSQRAFDDGGQINGLSHEPVIDAVLAAAESLDPATPLGEFPPEQATIGAEVDKEMSLALMRILAPRPVTREELRAQALGYTQAVMAREFAALGADTNPFGLETLTSRLNYIDLDTRGDRSTPTGATPAATTSGAETPDDPDDTETSPPG